VSSTFEILKSKYGAVLTLKQLAEVLSRKPEGLRQALLKKEPWTRELNEAKRYIGNKVYFPVDVVTALLDGTSINEESNSDGSIDHSTIE